MTMGVIDTGVDNTHTELSGKVDVMLAYGNPSAYDGNGHGTHTAGTVGAESNNGVGVAGTDWKVRQRRRIALLP